MRILVAANVPDDRAGGATRIMGFTHDRIAIRGHSVEYFYAAAAGRYGVSGRWARFTFPVAVVRFLRAQLSRGIAYDVVNIHEPSGALLVHSRRWLGNPAIVATSHGLERRVWELALEELRLGRDGPSLKTRVIYPATSLWQSEATLRHADHVFCVSGQDGAFLRRRFGSRTPPITRIYSGADPAFARAAAGRRYDRAERLLFAGTWRKNKGIEDLVPAFTALAGSFPSMTLTILGGGFPPDVVRGSFRPVVRARVQCVQARTEEETMRAYADHDLFVLPSLFEGTPLTMMEAMASGLPVVTTNTCGMAEVIRDGDNGLLVPTRAPLAIEAAVARLARDAELRARLGRNAQADVRQYYSWEQSAQTILRVYETLAVRRSPPPLRV